MNWPGSVNRCPISVPILAGVPILARVQVWHAGCA